MPWRPRSYGDFDGWRPYVPVAERRRRAAAKLAKLGVNAAPVEIAGRTIATTFWGKAWCHNLEAYSDYANRLPRGRTYVRNGSVVDLQIEAGTVRARVSGSDLYTVTIGIAAVPGDRWSSLVDTCAGQIDSLVELLQGTISTRVMDIVTQPASGLFPAPRDIDLSCSCPDWATMCKHVAATLYGVGARLDQAPALLFTLRGVDPAELVDAAVARPAATPRGPSTARRLDTADLSALFGIEIETGPPAERIRRVGGKKTAVRAPGLPSRVRAERAP